MGDPFALVVHRACGRFRSISSQCSPRLLTAEIRIGAMLTRASGHSLHAAMDGML
jgi:hypothetical protein